MQHILSGNRSDRKRSVSTLITDLDNTLYDWLGLWYATFGRLLDELVVGSGIARATIEAEVREVFQNQGTSEYGFLLEELPSLGASQTIDSYSSRYHSIIEAFRTRYTSSLRLYPSVWDTLLTIRGAGSQIVAYTESMPAYAIPRVVELGLDGVIDYLYTPPNHAMPIRPSAEPLYTISGKEKLHHTVHRCIPAGERKPNPQVLLDIIEDVGASPATAVYVGDNLLKDIVMAQAARVPDVYAKYGDVIRESEEYQALRRVSHWTDKEIEDEERAKCRIHASYIMDKSFGELLKWFDFVPLWHTREAEARTHEDTK